MAEDKIAFRVMKAKLEELLPYVEQAQEAEKSASLAEFHREHALAQKHLDKAHRRIDHVISNLESIEQEYQEYVRSGYLSKNDQNEIARDIETLLNSVNAHRSHGHMAYTSDAYNVVIAMLSEVAKTLSEARETGETAQLLDKHGETQLAEKHYAKTERRLETAGESLQSIGDQMVSWRRNGDLSNMEFGELRKMMRKLADDRSRVSGAILGNPGFRVRE